MPISHRPDHNRALSPGTCKSWEKRRSLALRSAWQHVGVPTAVAVVLATLFGAVVGSFVNVVWWRVPRGESIVQPGSHCPSCHTPLQVYELVPVISWLALRGR